jgi:drug/metabolite transporter (DMT)-like permease
MAAASPSAVAAVVVMAALSSALAGQLFLIGVRAVGVTRAAIFVNFVPVLTAGLAALLLDERLEAAQAVGGAAVLAGVWWTTRRRLPARMVQCAQRNSLTAVVPDA